jgi:hypothetical protein
MSSPANHAFSNEQQEIALKKVSGTLEATENTETSLMPESSRHLFQPIAGSIESQSADRPICVNDISFNGTFLFPQAFP